MNAVVDLARGTVHAQTEIAAAPEAVFRALTDPAELAALWGAPGAYRTSGWKVDLRPGGAWSAEAENVAAGRRTRVGGEYLAVEPPWLLEYTWIPDWEPALRTVVRIELEPVAGGTRVTLLHRGFQGHEAACREHGRGWDMVLGWLVPHVAGGAR
jgi:uncharacterized protein YndB with AHSA1/START domain